MAEPTELDDILERFERRAELANKEPTRDFTPEEVTNCLRQMFKLRKSDKKIEHSTLDVISSRVVVSEIWKQSLVI